MVEFIRKLVDAIGEVSGKSKPKAPGRRNPWPQCPACYHHVPELCADGDEDEPACGLGVRCGCCSGPHIAQKKAGDSQQDDSQQDGGKFQTSVQRDS